MQAVCGGCERVLTIAPARQRSVNDIAIVARGLGLILGPVKLDKVSPTARHRCHLSSELCCPDAEQWRWTSPFVKRFGVIPRVWCGFDFF